MNSNRYSINLRAVVLFGIGLASLVPGSGNLYAEGCASWTTAESQIKSAWPKKYPGEKILKISANGAASSYEKMESTGQERIESDAERYEYFVKVSYCRVPARVSVKRSNGSESLYEVSAIFKQGATGYQFSDIAVGDSSEVAASGQEPPTKDEIKKLIAELWISLHPDNRVEKVALSDPELKKDTGKNRWWYNVGADIYIINADGDKQKCVNDYTSIYRGSEGKEGQDNGPYRALFLETPSCN